MKTFLFRSVTEAMKASQLLRQHGVFTKTERAAAACKDCGCYMRLTVTRGGDASAERLLALYKINYETGDEP